LTVHRGEEVGLRTTQTLSGFTLPLDSGDRCARPLGRGNTYELIPAAGHAQR
jgi:hypothetical protein